MDDKHTAGPWHANTVLDEQYNDAVSVREPINGDLIATVAGGANARLIAAAPTLLEALRGAERSLSAHLADAARVAGVPIDTLCACNSVELAAVRAAINLATTGEES